MNDVAGAPVESDCVVATDGETVDLTVPGAGGTVSGGVLLRPVEGAAEAPGRAAEAAEMTLVYVPEGDSITVVSPPLAPSETPGECPGGGCGMAFELTPTGPGTFVLDADGRGAQPQLTLEAGGSGTGSSRVLSVVSGGGRLSARATTDGRGDARLALVNLGPSELPVLEISLVWPSRG